jgi:magnesium chelatase subunit D
MLRVSETLAFDETTADADLAFQLFVRSPMLFGGIVLRSYGPVRDDILNFIRWQIERHGPVVRIPFAIDNERLLGGLDLSATLAAGHSVTRPGLLDSAAGGAIIVPMAERLDLGVAAHIAMALDEGDLAAILLDDSHDADEAPPAVLTERIAFHVDTADLRGYAIKRAEWAGAVAPASVQSLAEDQLRLLTVTAAALGIGSMRALIYANSAARAHAALHGRTSATDDDVAGAIRLVLAPRATQLPQSAPPPEQEPEAEAPEPNAETEGDDNRNTEDIDLNDIMLEAAAAAIPQHILDQIDGKLRGAGKGQSGRSGQKQKSAQRGRPMGSRPGVPGHGRKLALIDSLRAAAPWQNIRRAAAPKGDTRTIHIRKSDLRVRRFEQRKESLTIFAVDASGSSALSRLAEAKGAVELMLAQAYVKRSQVALIAFRQSGAEILLPPTRSLTRARRALAALPGGGGTPLAAGLIAAQALAESASRAGQTPTIAILTDGKANVAMDGSANRTTATEQAHQAARNLARLNLHCIVIDISPRPREEAAELAGHLCGRYLPLPQARSAAMVAAIEGLG